jgi:hypothetical protein
MIYATGRLPEYLTEIQPVIGICEEHLFWRVKKFKYCENEISKISKPNRSKRAKPDHCSSERTRCG